MAKIKKKEKQTIKLKKGRELPKGSNLVNTTFKTKKIKIGDKNFNPFQAEPDKKSLVLKDLLSLNISKSNEKQKKLKNILNFISVDDSLLLDINLVLKKVIHLTKDHDPNIRKLTFNIIQFLCKKFSEIKQTPNFFMLETEINCTMTSMNTVIRYDSLKFLNILLNSLPAVVSPMHSLFEKLLNMISYISTDKKKQGKRTLIISPNEKTGTPEWRTSVLKCLATLLKANAVQEKSEINHKHITVTAGKDTYTLTKYSSFSLLIKSNLTERSNSVDFNRDFKSLETFVHNLMPVLFNCWIECIPSAFRSISRNNFETMSTILKIIQHLSKWISILPCEEHLKSLLHENYSEEMLEKFYSHFPFSPNYAIKSFVSPMNLSLCDIFSQIIMKGPYPHVLKENIFNHLFEELNTIDKNNLNSMKNILSVLEILLKDQETGKEFEPLLDKLLVLFMEFHPDNLCRNEIRNFFVKISLHSDSYNGLQTSPTLEEWWKLIPVEFLALLPNNFNESHKTFFDDILKVCDQHYSFLQALNEPENYKCLLLRISSDNPTVSIIAVKFLSKLDPIIKENFMDITNVLRGEITSVECVKTLLLALTKRAFTINPGFDIKDYLSFLMNLTFSTAICEDDDYDLTESAFDNLSHCIPFKLSSYTIISDKLSQNEKDITDFVINQLCLLPNQHLVQSFVQQYLDVFLQKRGHASPQFVTMVLKFASRFVYNSTMPCGELLLNLGDLMVGCYLFCISVKTISHHNAEVDLNVDYQSILQNLKSYTNCIGYSLKIIINLTNEINNSNQLFCVGQLLYQMLNSSGITQPDLLDLNTFLNGLKAKFGKTVTHQSWWSDMRRLTRHVSCAM